jgi:predicted adenylyl cyclase CyaB
LLIQEDTFFEISTGRLKLRVFDSRRGELIYYSRADFRAAKESTYLISKTDEPETLKAILAIVAKVQGIIRKHRQLYLVGQTRIHLDTVENLGQFIELEFVLRDDQAATEGHKIIQDLMEQLGLKEEDLIAKAYIDLLREANLQ